MSLNAETYGITWLPELKINQGIAKIFCMDNTKLLTSVSYLKRVNKHLKVPLELGSQN